MTITAVELLLYAGGLAILVITPGPVWVATIARTAAGGFKAAWPLPLGVAVGDAIWPLAAIFGLSTLVTIYADALNLVRYFGALIFVLMGIAILRAKHLSLTADKALTAPGFLAGFLAGLFAVIGNPKAIFFYLGLLPAFFDFAVLTRLDVAIICVTSLAVPLAGNLLLVVFVDQIRRFLHTEKAVQRVNLFSGFVLIFMGLAILVL